MPSPVRSETANAPAPVHTSGRGCPSLLFVFLVFTAIAGFFQWNEGAFRAEFGGHPDESAHYVTGLLVRDTLVMAKNYVSSGCHGSPVKMGKEFVQSYYDHYPKIGLGVWPPLFYLAQSAWTLPFGVSRCSILLLMASLAGLVGTILYSALRKDHGPPPAFFAGLAWICLPLAQQYYGMVMAEMLSTVLMFAATLRFGRYMDGRRPWDAYAFGLLASGAILTKGTGLALAFVPLLAIPLTGRFSLLKEKALWIGGAMVLILAGPWTFATRKLGEGGWEQPNPSWSFTRQALPYYGWKVCVAFGVLIGVLVLAGLVIRACRFVREDDDRGRWASLLALTIGVVVFQSIAPAGREARHIIPLLPCGLMFAAETFSWISRRVRSFGVPQIAAEWTMCAALILTLAGLPRLSGGSVPFFGSIGDELRFIPCKPAPKPVGGFGPVIADLMARCDKDKHGSVFLVSSDSSGEGSFIAEVAMQETHRPEHFAKRVSKELGVSSWSGGNYKPKFESDAALLTALTNGAFDFVVMDTAIPERGRRPHHDLLRRVVESHRDNFEKVSRRPLVRGGGTDGEILAYRVHRL